MNNNIKAIRLERGLTQEKLAEILNTTHVTISRYEKNNRGMTLHVLERVAKALNCSIVDLISDIEISAKKDLSVTEMQHIINICLDVIFNETGTNLDAEAVSDVIVEVYKWAKEENANDNDLTIFLKGMLRNENRIRHKG